MTPTPLRRAISAYRRLNLSHLPPERVTVSAVRRAKFLTPAELSLLVERYESGAKVMDLAAQFGIDRKTVSHHLRQQHVALRPYPPTADAADEMVRLYESGLPLAEVGQRVGHSAFVVQRELRTRGVAIRPKTRRKEQKN